MAAGAWPRTLASSGHPAIKNISKLIKMLHIPLMCSIVFQRRFETIIGLWVICSMGLEPKLQEFPNYSWNPQAFKRAHQERGQ